MAVSARDMANSPVMRFARRIQQSSPRARLLAGVWLLFALLVACGIHGSSTGVTAAWWMPEKPYSGYLLLPSSAAQAPPADTKTKSRRAYLMAASRIERWDELIIFTPYALSQLTQQPRFPVVNRSIGQGQNMLVVPHAPVAHVVTLARPATWGFFLLGAQRGVAWFWWFQVCACFTALFLLLEVVCNKDWKLAAFGAFLFSSSAYTILWSQWPAHVTAFAATACLCAYHLCASNSRRTLVLCGVLLGLSLPAFVMIMYPPWQVALAYFSVVLFAALFVRDRLHRTMKAQLGFRVVCIALAVLLAGGLTLAWLIRCLPDLKVMADTLYPGRRVSTGGDYSFALIFKGVYNLFTNELELPALKNPCEAASFYYLFPVVLLALPLAPRLRRGLGVVGWTMIFYIAAMLVFVLVGLPEKVARITLFSYIPSYRADLTIGLASIILTLQAAIILRQPQAEGASRWQRRMPAIVGAAVVLLFVAHAVFLIRAVGEFPPPQFGLWMALWMGIIASFLLAGKTRMFALCIAALQLATTLLYNPLSTNLDHLYRSELATEITRINRQSSERPFWVEYGGTYPGVLVEILGGRSLAGVQWPPQLGIWRALDPEGKYETFYNRYAEVAFEYTGDDQAVSFMNPNEGSMQVTVAPTNPTLKALGARYALFMGSAQQAVDASRLKLIYRSSFDNFSIYEIP
ncbi:MAG TPA: hypothetical protein VKA60_09460 [Blastocatellia bacterium]|nr:hypothetical protein [Blastocatellia bacterium]